MRALMVLFAIVLNGLESTSIAQEAGRAPTAIIVIGVETAHPSGVDNLFSDVPTIQIVFAPIDMRAVDIDQRRPPFIVERKYCNPLALERDSCPAAEEQTLYAAYEVPAGVYMLQSVTVFHSDLIDGPSATTELFHPPGDLVFRSTLHEALQSAGVPKLLLAPGGIFYAGNFVVAFEGEAPGIVDVRRDDARAAEVVREQTGIDLPLIFLETSVSFLQDGVES